MPPDGAQSRHGPQANAGDRLLAALRGFSRRRIRLAELRQAFVQAFPEFADQPDQRTRLAALLAEIAASGALRLPKNPRAWDRVGAADLPAFVEIDRPQAPRAAILPAGYAWHPLLAFAAAERNVQRLAALKAVNEWLKTDPDLRLVVPIKERSLEIFGDEKRLDALREGSTLFDGKLTLTNLACRICPVPLPYEGGPPHAFGRAVLILENNDTWASFCAWNRTAGRYGAVAYAGGGHAKGLGYDEIFIDELLAHHAATELLYFGDLDPRGLRIAASAARRRDMRGEVPLVPARPLYAWLLEHGRRVRNESRERAQAEDLAWLPESLRSDVESLFTAGERIAQEALGTRALMLGLVAP